MSRPASTSLIIAMAAVGLAAFPSARAETLHTCVGFIDSVPATITRQGVWCLRKDVSTALVSGNAITVAANNVTIDCNGGRIGGLAGGPGSRAHGIAAVDHQNTTVRNCNVRGFDIGISLSGGAGHLVEDNRLDANYSTAIMVSGSNTLVQRNLVYDTSGGSHALSVTGIDASGNILDNVVSGLWSPHEGGTLTAIRATGAGVRISGNTVARLNPPSNHARTDRIYGIEALSPVLVSDNHLTGRFSSSHDAFNLADGSQCRGNSAWAFSSSLDCPVAD